MRDNAIIEAVGIPKGIKLSSKGLIKIDSGAKIPETEFKLKITQGSQRFEKNYTVEVFDCEAQLEFAKNLKVQVGNQTQVFNAVLKNKNASECNISKYSISNAPDGVTIDSKTGNITVNTSKEIKETFVQTKAIVGSQTI